MKEKQETIYNEIPELRKIDLPREDGMRGIKSFVLRGGYLHTSDREAIEKFYPTYALPFRDAFLDYRAVFGNDNPVIMEIGFGMGDTTARIAKERSDCDYLACDVFLTGFAKLLKRAGEEKLDNLRLMRFDAVEILNHMISDNSLDGFHIFFPDPWPKTRHKKRRLIQVPFVTLLERKLKKGGYIYAVTDWDEYASQMLDVFSRVDGLVNPYDGYAKPRAWRPMTHFEKKGLRAERPIREIWVVKGGESATPPPNPEGRKRAD